MCLGLINWDWIIYRGLVLEKTESPSLSQRLLIACDSSWRGFSFTHVCVCVCMHMNATTTRRDYELERE